MEGETINHQVRDRGKNIRMEYARRRLRGRHESGEKASLRFEFVDRRTNQLIGSSMVTAPPNQFSPE
jgi:hypothetical protein